MDLYALERHTLDRHREMANRVEARMRARGWAVEARLAELVAERLRRLADRLDRPDRPEPSEGRLRVLGERFGDPGGRDSGETMSSAASAFETA